MITSIRPTERDRADIAYAALYFAEESPADYGAVPTAGLFSATTIAAAADITHLLLVKPRVSIRLNAEAQVAAFKLIAGIARDLGLDERELRGKLLWRWVNTAKERRQQAVAAAALTQALAGGSGAEFIVALRQLFHVPPQR